MGTAILGNLILLVIFGAVFLRIVTFIIGIVKNIFNYYLSFSGFGYFFLSSRLGKLKTITNKNRIKSLNVNPSTGLLMISSTLDVGGNAYGSSNY